MLLRLNCFFDKITTKNVIYGSNRKYFTHKIVDICTGPYENHQIAQVGSRDPKAKTTPLKIAADLWTRS